MNEPQITRMNADKNSTPPGLIISSICAHLRNLRLKHLSEFFRISELMQQFLMPTVEAIR